MTDEYDLDSGPDPAAYAADRPEDGVTESVMTVHAVGIGPGNPDYLVPRSERAIREADVVVGFETVVEFVRDRTDAECLTCGYRDEADALATFADRVAGGEQGTAVLMGDPNHSGYQFVGKVGRAVDDATGGSVDVRVVPGISSLQVAASRARTPMENATFVTLHKSGDLSEGMDRLRRDVGKRHLLVLPRPFDRMPGDVAADLLEHGGDPDAEALVCERLTHDDERITRTTLRGRAGHAGGDKPGDSPFSDLSVLVVRR
ncbi:precorrin-6y C5,15-methyltransferase (decarboxylating) subunit CbiE [Halorubrum ezzemoulense DSM 17463]|uniref:Precorrin-6y C5,15-methyltransferase (Decarboxylating) subunit CbiE n=1 Tax=Halorubrum ezzemoulense DSM 17463 TaxID=1121945 RepID=A0A1X4H9P6_HALEZ|nr:cobalt-precorrin-7 (C(5))-methyltransferase [Halorubrum ezzemoulense]OSP09172.1 precorrin-6y C5,15-methyltransferase (decarboxylating) subunit CbiE [Halorubrum ezzemoulense DSM 17463]